MLGSEDHTLNSNKTAHLLSHVTPRCLEHRRQCMFGRVAQSRSSRACRIRSSGFFLFSFFFVFVFSPKCIEKPLEGFDQGSAMIMF